MKPRSTHLLVAALLAGCESHPDIAWQPDAVPEPMFELAHLSPADGAVGVDRAPEFLAVFSSEVAPGTVTPGVFSLSSGGALVPSAVSVDGAAVRLEAGARLRPLASYRLDIDAGLGGSNGALLGTSLSASFTTRDVAWSPSVAIDAVGAGGSPSVGVDGAGDAIAIWTESLFGTIDVMTSSYSRTANLWTPPETLAAGTADATPPKIFIDRSGNGIAIWMEDLGTAGNSPITARYVKGVGWAAPMMLEGNNPDVLDFSLSANVDGIAYVVFTQFDGVRYNAWSRRFVPPASWTSVEPVEAMADTVGAVEVAVSADGSAVAVWDATEGGGRVNVWANRYLPGSGWESPELIESETDDCFGARVAMDAGGNAIAIWLCQPAGDLWANRLSGGTWGTSAKIEEGAQPVGDASIAMQPDGSALVVWTADAGGTYAPWSTSFEPGSGWTGGALLENSSIDSTIRVVLDDSDRAFVFWRALDADGMRMSLWSKRRLPDGWQPATLMEQSNAASFRVPDMGFAPSGDVVAVWNSVTVQAPPPAVSPVPVISFGNGAKIWSAVTE